MYSAATTYMVAKLGTLKTEEYTQIYGTGSLLKLNSVNAVKLENCKTQQKLGLFGVIIKHIFKLNSVYAVKLQLTAISVSKSVCLGLDWG